MSGFIDRLWHRVQGHTIVFHPAMTPAYQLDDGTNVFFVGDDLTEPHSAHYHCSCDKRWS